MSRNVKRRSATVSPIPGLICATLLALASCAQPESAPPQSAAAPADPIMRAVAAAVVNVPVSITTPADPTPVTLVVTADYISAEGQECRVYTFAGRQNLACADGATWRQIPSLAASDNPGLAP